MRCETHGEAGRGPFSLQAGQLESRVLEWIQGDPFFDAAKGGVKTLIDFILRAKRQCMKEREIP